MAFTVTLLEDHLGQNQPTVVGHEYCVDAAIVYTAYAAADRVTALSLGLSNITAIAITGNSQPAIYTADVVCADTTGLYATTSTFKVFLMNNADADEVEEGDGALVANTTIRVRVWGNL